MMAEGTIMKALSGFYYVDDGASVYTCRGRGRLRHIKMTPLVGDLCRAYLFYHMQKVIALRFHSSWCKNVMLHEVSYSELTWGVVDNYAFSCIHRHLGCRK